MNEAKQLRLPGDLEEGELAVYLAWIRIGIAAAAFVASRRVARLGSGDEGSSILTKSVLRSWAGREAALGVGLLMALRHDTGVRGWLEAGALADGADAAAALTAFKGVRRLGITVASAGTAVLETRRAASLASSAGGTRSRTASRCPPSGCPLSVLLFRPPPGCILLHPRGLRTYAVA